MVLATATTYLLKYGYAEQDNITYHKYYEELTIVIKGKEYQGIILDSCGACMKKPIIDLFVTDDAHSITTNDIQIK